MREIYWRIIRDFFGIKMEELNRHQQFMWYTVIKVYIPFEFFEFSNKTHQFIKEIGISARIVESMAYCIISLKHIVLNL